MRISSSTFGRLAILLFRDTTLTMICRFVMSSGQVDFTKDNHDELINPGQSLWTWKTIADYAKETKGRPDLVSKEPALP